MKFVLILLILVTTAAQAQIPSKGLILDLDADKGVEVEGIWGNVTDHNRVWIGSRNGITFGRWDDNNPMVLADKPLNENKYYVVAGRMGSGTGEVQIELFVNSHNRWRASLSRLTQQPIRRSSLSARNVMRQTIRAKSLSMGNWLGS